MEQLRQRFCWPDPKGVPAIMTVSPHYEATWACPAIGTATLDLRQRGDPGGRLELVVRSVGPAGGPIRRIEWDGKRLTINDRWSAIAEPQPQAVFVGHEGDPRLEERAVRGTPVAGRRRVGLRADRAGGRPCHQADVARLPACPAEPLELPRRALDPDLGPAGPALRRLPGRAGRPPDDGTPGSPHAARRADQLSAGLAARRGGGRGGTGAGGPAGSGPGTLHVLRRKRFLRRLRGRGRRAGPRLAGDGRRGRALARPRVRPVALAARPAQSRSHLENGLGREATAAALRGAHRSGASSAERLGPGLRAGPQRADHRADGFRAAGIVHHRRQLPRAPRGGRAGQAIETPGRSGSLAGGRRPLAEGVARGPAVGASSGRTSRVCGPRGSPPPTSRRIASTWSTIPTRGRICLGRTSARR